MSHNICAGVHMCTYQQHIRLSQGNIFNTVANRCTAAVTILLIAKAAIKVLHIFVSAKKGQREFSD